ncbi:unnamed protein product [Calicophoron daubneyi]|uniref:Major facilitator superfamily domain-containing protein 3 n=1 Tax=Calicophoron daubneyi TaxID=300641 RepID=A0AAV2TRY2_CALDB
MSWTLFVLLYLYILEGIPYGLQSRFLPLVLRSRGLSLTTLGFYKLLYVPWLFKSFYAPLVDTRGTKRLWLIASLTGLLSVTLALSVSTEGISESSSHRSPSSLTLTPLAICLLLYNFFAATQDIAVDGIALLVLTSKEIAAGNTVQVVGYKLGGVIGGGLLTTLASFVSIHQLFAAIAGVYFTGVILCSTSGVISKSASQNYTVTQKCTSVGENSLDSKASVSKKDDKDDGEKSYWHLLRNALVNSPGSCYLIILLLIYKLGEQGAMNMLPLLLFDRGASLAKIGLWNGMVGQISSLAGSAAGYKFLSNNCSSASALVRLMNIRALLQIPLIIIAVDSSGSLSPFSAFYLGALCMNVTLFFSGAITTVVFTLMMHCTRSESSVRTQATHYTVLSTAELLGKLIFGVVAASFTDWVGYGVANIAFFLLSLLPIYFIRSHRRCFAFEPTL